MRINRIRGRGFIAFPGDFDVDLDIMNGEVSAVVGANGAGKSTLLEITAGAVIALNKKFLQTPTRGPLKDLAITRDAFIEVTFEYEKHYIVKHSIDAKSGKIETSITCDGAPVLQKGQVSEYLTWAIQTLPPAEVFYASLFAAQGNKGLLGMKEGPRKETILRVLGLERLEKLAKCARDRASIVSAELSGVRARISELESTRTVGEYQMEVARLTDSSRRAEDALRLGEITVKELQTKNEAIANQRTEHNALLARRVELESQEAKLAARIVQIDALIQNNSGLLEKAGEIRAAVTRSSQLANIEESLAEAGRLGTVLGEETTFLVELDAKMSQFNAIALEADAIRKAVTESTGYQASLKTKQAEANAQLIREVETESALQAVRTRINSNAQVGAELQRTLNGAELIVGTEGYLKTQALASVDAVKALEAELARKEITQGQYWTEIEALQVTVSTSKDKRIRNFQDPLELIAERKVDDPAQTAADALSTNEDLEAEAEEVPARLADAKKQWSQIGIDLTDLRSTLAIERKAAAKLSEIETAENTIAESRSAIEASTALYYALVEESNVIIHKQDALTTEKDQTQSDIRWLNEQIAGLEPLAGKSESLTQVEAVSVEVEKQKIRCGAEIERLTSELTKLEVALGRAGKTDNELREEKMSVDKTAKLAVPLGEAKTKIAAYQEEREKVASDREGILELLSKVITDAVEPPKLINLSAEEQAVDGARTDLSNCQAALAVAQRDLATAEEKERRREELTIQAQGLEEKQSDWTRLAQDLGKDGLQALEIAAAGSEITTLANDLLQSAGDPRTVSVETVRMDSTGKRELEGCEITVMESGKPDKTAEQLSGGEGVFVGEALSLAMVMVGCRRSAASSPTIVRDESGSALDAGHGPMYVAMLRRAAEIVGAARVLFVSHSPDLQALADSTISVAAGSVSVN